MNEVLVTRLKFFQLLSSPVLTVSLTFVVLQDFVEMYELKSDPWELTNLANTSDPTLVHALRHELHTMVACSGASCNIQVQGPLKFDHS